MVILNKHKVQVFMMCLLVLILFSAAGCKKKKSEPAAASTEIKNIVSQAIEQKTCPVMGGAINKDLYVEYKGKKVYFCCPECKGKFNAEPEKYLSKLPQFKN